MDILKPMLHVSWRTYIDDLCYMELKYVNEMSLMMRTYVKPIIVSCQSKSFETRWENLQLFGNLREIYEFHKFIFQPKLLRCLGDVEKIAKLFIKTINDGYFNYYVCHSIVEKSSENWRKYYGPALEMLSEKSGIQFQFSPMNQLLGYKKILHEINACLHKDFDENFQKIVLMLDTEKCLQKLIDRVLEASFVHKIMEINKISINAQKELKTLIESKEETVDLFLVPREDCFYGCRQPVCLSNYILNNFNLNLYFLLFA